ncbi:MAG: cation transporter [Bacteroidales bacterium]|nr:cation transporter [Bacteroidales bacterium]
MTKSTFNIPGMDCPSEESMIRLKLEDVAEIKQLEFNIPERRLDVYHTGGLDKIESSLKSLNLGATMAGSEHCEINPVSGDRMQTKVLWAVLAINLSLFVAEMITGFISRSMGLVADSIDMLADAFVYGLSLYAVGGTVNRKKKIARTSGYFQMTLAFLGFAEVIRRFTGFDTPPDFTMMIIVSLAALAGNTLCLYLLQKAKSDEAHMKASWIFTSNDVLANLGVITAALLVLATGSNRPDLIIGTIVFALVMRGAFRILKLAK